MKAKGKSRPRKVVTPGPKSAETLDSLTEGIHSVISDFFNELKNLRREAAGSGTRMPPFIRTVKDLDTVIRLQLLLLGEQRDKEKEADTPGQQSWQEQQLEEALKADPELREKLAEVYRRAYQQGPEAETGEP